VAGLSDRLDYVIGKKAADPLVEHFGIVTVNDLLRHYPRKYSDGMTALEDGEELEELEEGEHVTFLGVISKAEVLKAKRPPYREYMVVTLGDRRPKVTATFFNPKYLRKS
jgi:ATP-dependent DNA helicase RecG